MYENVKIKMTGPGRGEVHIDGEKVKGVKSFSLSGGVGEVTELTVTVYVETADYDGQVCEVMANNGEESRKFIKVKQRG